MRLLSIGSDDDDDDDDDDGGFAVSRSNVCLPHILHLHRSGSVVVSCFLCRVHVSAISTDYTDGKGTHHLHMWAPHPLWR